MRAPPHLANWLCIHRYEGSWPDPGAPYYGGLQMDLPFQQAYGAWLLRHKGTANHWTPLEQIWTAERARRARGFYPWPNTAPGLRPALTRGTPVATTASRPRRRLAVVVLSS